MSKHTPGPWKICAYCYDRDEASSTGRRVRLTSCSDEAEGFIIASTNGTITELPSHRREADARLIAAAPELLEALEVLLSYANRYSDTMREIGRGAEQLGEGADSSSIAAQARRAIAKAKGVMT